MQCKKKRNHDVNTEPFTTKKVNLQAFSGVFTSTSWSVEYCMKLAWLVAAWSSYCTVLKDNFLYLTLFEFHAASQTGRFCKTLWLHSGFTGATASTPSTSASTCFPFLNNK